MTNFDTNRRKNKLMGGDGFDPFQTFLCEGAEYTHPYDLIKLKPVSYIPSKLITFSEARNPKKDDPDAAVCFFERDEKFWAFVRNPKRYLPLLKRHPAVVMPDISSNYDMPAPVRWNSIFQNYALAHWMQEQGLVVIPNARTSPPFPPDMTLGGIPKESVIVIGAHGNLKNRRSRRHFVAGVEEVCDYLSPTAIVVYGSDIYDVFSYPKRLGIDLHFYPSSTAAAHASGRGRHDG